MAATDIARQVGEGCRTVPLAGHVGFDSLPDQLVNKSVSQGFCFNILCVGETGLGKSTLMDTLFNTKFEGEPATHTQPGVQLRSNTYDLQESNVGLKLTIVSTVGFGDQINKEDSYKPIVEFIDAQFEAYLQEELKIRRVLHTYHDSRIHACLYFIAPTGHSLKSLDLVTMKKLDSKVNIIPIIAKSDAISKSELTKFKIKITSELVSNGVQIYQFPTDDESVAEINGTMNAHLPFAVIGSTEELKIGNKMMKARQYPWGTVQVENEAHCDFVKLREMLIRVNMEDLREQTHSRHYELYRRCKLEEMGFKDTDPDSKPFRYLSPQPSPAHPSPAQPSSAHPGGVDASPCRIHRGSETRVPRPRAVGLSHLPVPLARTFLASAHLPGELWQGGLHKRCCPASKSRAREGARGPAEPMVSLPQVDVWQLPALSLGLLPPRASLCLASAPLSSSGSGCSVGFPVCSLPPSSPISKSDGTRQQSLQMCQTSGSSFAVVSICVQV
ncbi:septin-6 isoform X2 [Camelus ferus]|uniref:Septin-6 isoform X2 n=1 Tax=Camelus ferus TaxID=419612 RepID=A0A8B8SRD7_CAMFR|nr:septin-6 isoform X2 [Camelus ferus]